MGGMFVHEQAKYLVDAGCELKVIAPVAYCPGIITKLGGWSAYANIPGHDTIDRIPVYYPRYFRLPGKWFHPLSCYAEYSGLLHLADSAIRAFKPDVIHAHMATPPGFVGLLLKKRYGLPLVCSIRGDDINVYPRYGRLSMHLTKRVITGADRLVSVSAALKEAAGLIAKPKNEISVVYNGCDHDTFKSCGDKRTYLRKALNIPETAKLLVFVGDVSKEKGVCELIEAFRKVRNKKKDLHLVVIGTPHDAVSKIFARMENGMKRSVHMTGGLPHWQIPQYLSAADIFVLPSHHEGLPNAVLEAMACGLPVIATAVGGIPEAVEEGKSGFLVNKQNAKSLAVLIEYLVRNDRLIKQMGIRGREIVETKFSWKCNAGIMIEIYKEAIKLAA